MLLQRFGVNAQNGSIVKRCYTPLPSLTSNSTYNVQTLNTVQVFHVCSVFVQRHYRPVVYTVSRSVFTLISRRRKLLFHVDTALRMSQCPLSAVWAPNITSNTTQHHTVKENCPPHIKNRVTDVLKCETLPVSPREGRTVTVGEQRVPNEAEQSFLLSYSLRPTSRVLTCPATPSRLILQVHILRKTPDNALKPQFL